jgi:hypothetical protein
VEARTGDLSVLSVIRSGGVALIAGGVLLILYIILQVVAGSPADPENVVKTTFSLAFHVRVAGVLFMLLGLVGLFVRHIGWIGWFGMTAFVFAFAGTAMFGGEAHLAATAFPFIAENDAALFESFLRSPTGAVLGIAGMLLLLVGYIMLGIVLFRVALSPRWSAVMLPAGWLILVGAPPGQLLTRLAGAILVGAGLIAQGWALWSSQEESVWQAAADSP